MNYHSNDGVRGVGGLLLVLCVVLTVFAPLGILAGFGQAARLSKDAESAYPAFSNWVLAASLPRLALVVMSITAGIALWKVKPGAVATTMRFLAVYLAYSILHVGVAYLGDLPPATRDAIRDGYLQGALGVFGFSLGWQQYLQRSERVKNTFG